MSPKDSLTRAPCRGGAGRGDVLNQSFGQHYQAVFPATSYLLDSAKEKNPNP